MSTKHKQSKPKSSRYPTEWSNWSWSKEYNCDVRYRQIALGDASGTSHAWEYDYRQVAATGYTPRSKEADPPPLDTIHESSPASYSPTNFRYDSQSQGVSGIIQSLSTTSIAPVQSKGQEAGFTSSTPTSDYYASSVPTPSSFSGGGTQNNASFSGTRKIFTENPKSNVDLDPNFRVHKSHSFRFGKVFKVLWSEPEGSCGTELSQAHHSLPAKYNQKTFQKVRRFLIVDSKRGHSICLPILTYGGRGTTKYGAHPEDHALIYTGKREPALKQGETLSKKLIRVDPIDGSEALDPSSRLNYAKHYTVEHNVKVFFVGRVIPEHEQRVVAAYNNTNKPLPDRRHSNSNRDFDESVSHTQGADPISPADSSSAASYWAAQAAQSTPSASYGRQTDSTAPSSWDTSANQSGPSGTYGMQTRQPVSSSWGSSAGQPISSYAVNSTPSYQLSSVSTSLSSGQVLSTGYSANRAESSYGSQQGFYNSRSSQPPNDSRSYGGR